MEQLVSFLILIYISFVEEILAATPSAMPRCVQEKCSCDVNGTSLDPQEFNNGVVEWEAVALAGVTGAVSSSLGLTILKVLWMLKSQAPSLPQFPQPRPNLPSIPPTPYNNQSTSGSSSTGSWAEQRRPLPWQNRSESPSSSIGSRPTGRVWPSTNSSF